MRVTTLAHLSDRDLAACLAASVRQERSATATVLAHIAEFDVRKLYVLAGHPSMHSYCVHELGFSEDAAFKRIQAARIARRFPAIFELVSEGRLHLTGLGLLAHHLTPENADEILAAAAGRTKAQIEDLLAQRFPRTESLPMVLAVPATVVASRAEQDVRATSCQLAPAQVAVTIPASKVTPIAAERFVLQVSIGRSLRDKLQRAEELASHRIQPGDLADLLEQMADAYIAKLEKRKFAASDRPRSIPRPTTGNRTIPAHVRRAVSARDEGRCTYTNDNGQRCPARTRLEFDHIVPVARGGEATVDNLRLRCRAHNQYAAERAFGAEFMEHKREEARRVAHERRRAVPEQEQIASSGARTAETVDSVDKDVVPWLRQLGFRADESREAAKLCGGIPDATLEQRVRTALSYFRPRFEHRSRIASRRET